MMQYAHEQPRYMRPLSDLYFMMLSSVLLGYALMGKGFAYLGFPPFFVGEIALLTGGFVFLRTGCLIASLTTLPMLLLVAAMVWVLARTLPLFDEHGFDALRDSVIIVYGCFAFVVTALLLEDGRRIETAIRYYGKMLASFPAMLVGFWLTRYWSDYIPRIHDLVPIVDIPASAVGTHLAGSMVFVLIGYRKVSPIWIAVWLATLALVAASNRGATLAVVVMVGFAMLMLRQFRLILTVLVAAICILTILLVFETTFGEYKEAQHSAERSVSAHQIIENAKSIIGQSNQQAEATKQWRLKWWQIIINDTIFGPNFWTGRGFGLNLAEADGFGDSPGLQRAPTRSPHNAIMTILARSGVLGLVLWMLVLISWFGMVMRSMLMAYIRGHKDWAKLFLFVSCYAGAILINAMFDVVLEGPMQGIWFWCLVGFGVGSVMIYRAQPGDEPWR